VHIDVKGIHIDVHKPILAGIEVLHPWEEKSTMHIDLEPIHIDLVLLKSLFQELCFETEENG
jgi:hypothetical protein